MKNSPHKALGLPDLVTFTASQGDDAIERIGRNLYAENLLTSTHSGVFQMHDGEQVKFQKTRFDHAFFMAGNWQTSKEKTGIDVRRVARLRWILPIIQGEILSTECWLVTENGGENRLYLSFGLGYVIWVESSNKGWWFSSAYTASGTQIRGYVKGAKLIWKYGQ
jgi:hypothetical protein